VQPASGCLPLPGDGHRHHRTWRRALARRAGSAPGAAEKRRPGRRSLGGRHIRPPRHTRHTRRWHRARGHRHRLAPQLPHPPAKRFLAIAADRGPRPARPGIMITAPCMLEPW